MVAELTAFLVERPASCDLIVSADTLVYFGDLAPLFTAAVLLPYGQMVGWRSQWKKSLMPKPRPVSASS